MWMIEIINYRIVFFLWFFFKKYSFLLNNIYNIYKEMEKKRKDCNEAEREQARDKKGKLNDNYVNLQNAGAISSQLLLKQVH